MKNYLAITMVASVVGNNTFPGNAKQNSKLSLNVDIHVETGSVEL